MLYAIVSLNLAMIGVVHHESKDPRVNRPGVAVPGDVEGALGLITTEDEALLFNVNQLELFEIVRGHGCEAIESWVALYQSREINWSRRNMSTQCFPYELNTGTVNEHPAAFERAMDGENDRTWRNGPVRWETSKRAARRGTRVRPRNITVTPI